MSEKIRQGKPHELPPSPCETCEAGNWCKRCCEVWQAWMKDAWETVTGRSKRNGR